ncbi:MAG: type I-B CRISPR-associated protein Cas7/Cst2/DevR [Candidatus Altiarchaeales archaeon A3]|nr:MAG: type I-B CRISPR-associated protein Cas7/Cst2/DevR [Candidatus Altiarchaeales archaeon A3]
MKAIEIVTLTKVDPANLNSNGTEGVITVLKKFRDPIENKEFIRVSGQSVKYHLKEILYELEENNKQKYEPYNLDGVAGKSTNAKQVLVSPGDPEKYISDDLFGYMKTDTKKKRIAPVRTCGMVSLFPYEEDRDFGVRYDESGNEKHNIFETEFSANIMRSNFFIEVDRIGVFDKTEVEDAKAKTMSPEERNNRIMDLIKCILSYHHETRSTRFLTKVYPEAVVVLFLNKKIPVIGDNLRITEKKENKYLIDAKLLNNVLNVFEDSVVNGYIGILGGKFDINKEEVTNAKIKVLELKELWNALEQKKYIE